MLPTFRSSDQEDRGASRRRRRRTSPNAKLSPHSKKFLADLFPDVYPKEESSAARREGVRAGMVRREAKVRSGAQEEGPSQSSSVHRRGTVQNSGMERLEEPYRFRRHFSG